MKESNIYVTITEGDNCYALDELKVGEIVNLVKEPNQFDDESIKVLNSEGCQYGYICNSVSSVARGTHSAGFINHLFKYEIMHCQIMFIFGGKAIGRLI